MADEYFFALTLKGAKTSEVWNPEVKCSDEYQSGHKLIIKQALLGPKAEENVVQVKAMTWKDPVSFRLIIPRSTSDIQSVTRFRPSSHYYRPPLDPMEEFDEMEDEIMKDEEGEEEAGDENDEESENKKAKTNDTKG